MADAAELIGRMLPGSRYIGVGTSDPRLKSLNRPVDPQNEAVLPPDVPAEQFITKERLTQEGGQGE